jgi:F-type H+-transporting ATPase subunit delta
MKTTKITTRYAKALFELAIEQNIAEQVNKDMQFIIDIYKSNKDFKLMLLNPTIKPDKKQNILKKIFENHLHKVSLNFLIIITHKRREAFINGIAGQFINLYKEYKGIKTIALKTAVKVDDNIRKNLILLLKKQTNSEIELIEKTDKNLIGGFILSTDDKQFDSSISNKLQRISKELDINNL